MQVSFFGSTPVGTGNTVEFFFWQCQYKNHICESERYTSVVTAEPSECIFVSVMLSKKRPNHIFASISYDCINLPSAVRTKERFLDIQREECKFKKSFEKVPSINFEFVPFRNRRHDGVVLVLPCSPGGYVVNPINGRFVYDYYCKTLFFPEVHGSAARQIIEDQYDGNENLVFPNDPTVIASRKNKFRPIYIDSDGTPKPPSRMKAKESPPNGFSPTHYRLKCDLYLKLTPLNLTDAMLDIEDLILSTRLVILDTTIPPGRTVKTTTTTEPEEMELTTDIPTPTEAYPPDEDAIKEMVVVTYMNRTSDILITFLNEQGVFSAVDTIAPGVPPPPTPKIPLWLPDYEDVLENKIRHGRRIPRKSQSNHSRHHEAGKRN